MQETVNHKVLFQRLHHRFFTFGYSVYTALFEYFLGHHMIIIHAETVTCKLDL